MPTVEKIMAVLATIPDPEMPISIVDLGLIERVDVDPPTAAGETAGSTVRISVLPTFIGCPALPMIEADIKTRVGELAAVEEVVVRLINDPPWTVDRITAVGRESLREHGVTVPERGSRLPVAGHGSTVELRTSAVPCPFCGSTETRLDSPFGPTRCRMIYYCDSCRNGFEHMKRLPQSGNTEERVESRE